MRFRNLSAALIAGAVAIVGMTAVARADMSFRVVSIGGAVCRDRCAMAIVADGEITDATPDEFLDFVRANAQSRNLHSVVLLNSPGGKVVASMALGRVFRKVGALTIVARAGVDSDGRGYIARGRCFSACVYALMGGRKRIVPPESVVGIHRMVAVESGADPAGGSMERRRFDNGDMRNMLSKYSADMGVSRDLINTAEQTPNDGIHIVSARELARWRLGTSRF